MNDLNSTTNQASNFFKKQCNFVKSVVSLSHLPIEDRPEVAFVGRSNVGKSSLMNAVLGRNNLVRTSKTPGRTQCLNFFDLDQKLYLVDVPGYGYTQAPKKISVAWVRLLKSYLFSRNTLNRIFLLIDARHGLKENDLKIMKDLDTEAVSYQLVLTKIDKISAADRANVILSINTAIPNHGAAYPILLSTSSAHKIGISDLRESIYTVAMAGTIF